MTTWFNYLNYGSKNRKGGNLKWKWKGKWKGKGNKNNVKFPAFSLDKNIQKWQQTTEILGH